MSEQHKLDVPTHQPDPMAGAGITDPNLKSIASLLSVIQQDLTWFKEFSKMEYARNKALEATVIEHERTLSDWKSPVRIIVAIAGIALTAYFGTFFAQRSAQASQTPVNQAK